MISKTPQYGMFELFSSVHIITIVVITGLFVLFTYLCKHDGFKGVYKKVLLISLIVLDLAFRLWAGFYETPDYVSMFSLHISSASIILSIWLLIKFNQKVFNVLFFWGIVFVPQAIITPGLGRYNFPHLRFFHILLVHFLVIFTIVFFIFVEKKRLSQKCLKDVLISTEIYGVIIFFVNIIFSTNYMFIGRKTNISLIAYLGDWPYFVVVLNIMMIIVFVILNKVYRIIEEKTYEYK